MKLKGKVAIITGGFSFPVDNIQHVCYLQKVFPHINFVLLARN